MPGEVLPDYQQQVDLLKRSSVEPRPIVLCHEGTVGQAGAVEGRSSTPTLDDEEDYGDCEGDGDSHRSAKKNSRRKDALKGHPNPARIRPNPDVKNFLWLFPCSLSSDD